MVNKQTGNFLIDSGLQEQFATPVSWYKSIVPDNNAKIKELSIPSWIPDESTMRTQDKFFEDMATVQEREWVTDSEALDLVQNYYNEKGYTVEWMDLIEEVEEEIEDVIEEDISWLDIWVKAWIAISDTAKDFKFESNIDDWIIKSGLKFLGNLPANTVQIAWDLISIASDPVGTIDSVSTLAKAWIETTLNKIFLEEWKEVFTSEEVEMVANAVGAELEKLWEPWRIKELLVENPADVLLTFAWGAGIAKNIAKSKGLTWLVTKLETVEKALNPIKIQADVVKGISKGTQKVKSSLFPEKTLDELVLEISQWEKANIPAVKKTLSLIDTKDIKTFDDFNTTIWDKISEIAKKQDSLLPTDKIHNIDDLKTTVWKRDVNFIRDSLDDLENVWVKENDLELLKFVDDFKESDLISTKDINDLARFYGSKFKDKAFNKAWDAKTSVSATRFENNRVWLKGKSRELMPDDTVKTLDSELSSLFETKNLTSKTVKKVDDLFKKLNKRWLGARIGGTIGKAINFISLWTAGGLVQAFIWSNVWQKTMNNLAIQANLAKNLKRFEDLAKRADKMTDKNLEKEVKKLFSDFVWDNALKIEAVSNLEDNK